jgi:uncharacterized membrane protein
MALATSGHLTPFAGQRTRKIGVTPGRRCHKFLPSKSLDVPAANGINAAGQIVGVFYGGHGFLLNQGSYTPLGPPGAVYRVTNGINDSSQIVGSYSDATGQHGFLFDQGSYITLDVPGSFYTVANGINDSGQIVGSYSDAAGTHGFLATPVP